MKKENRWKYLLLALMILNICLIGFLILKRPGGHHPPKHDFMRKAIKVLNLDEEQAAEFKLLAKTHHEQMKIIRDEQKEGVMDYFENSSPNDEASLSRIKDAEGRKIETTRQHFEEIKALLNEDQMEQFKKFRKRALRVILTQGDKKHQSKRGRRPE